MARLRPAVAELATAGAIQIAGGLLAGALAFAALPRGERAAALVGAAVGGAIILLIGMLQARRGEREVIAEAAAADPGAPVGRPGRLAAGSLAIMITAGAALGLLEMPLVPFCVFVACFGVWPLGLAARLRAWERRTGRTLLLLPDYRWRGRNGRRLGHGWTDPANFVIR